ncbi:hypothetical protein GCM10008967_20270 [Bacillus carboniphilus]|uniref:Aminoglycoside phosphotransferase domain-containing protein n=1 Tax=Bacillus carboniphilus TaxID=86663 RepID=A0ABN0W9D7_9BACI
MANEEVILQEKVKAVIIKEFGWNVCEIKIHGRGVQNIVLMVEEQDMGRFAVRVPYPEDRQQFPNRERDRSLLLKEADITNYCSRFNIPVPKVHHTFLSDELDFIIVDFIEGDPTKISHKSIGEMVQKIHRIPVEPLFIRNQGERTIYDYMANRIAERVKFVKPIIDISSCIPNRNEIEQILAIPTNNKESLLHLDVRPPNLISKKGEIGAILDWDNALKGDPVLELMRVEESMELDFKEFMKGYTDYSLLNETPMIVQNLYRLDTALMLTILFEQVLKNQMKSEYYQNRLKFLSLQVAKEV